MHLARALGAGGFERLVAIKVMHPHIASEPEFVDMFLDEGRIAAGIRHPNVVSTIDVQRDESGLFLVMDYIEGAALQLILRELWKRGQNLRVDVALRIFLDTLAGLHAAHELCGADGESVHLVHRDVSPQNVLVGIDGVARLTDFGVARARSRLATTQGGQLKGKLTYMAPEQVRGEAIDRRTDIYAAGVVLWELLAGERLIRGDNDAAIVQRIMDGISRSPRDVVPSVPEPIAAACMRALRFEPADRYPTAAVFAEALEAAAGEGGVVIAAPRAVSALVKSLNIHGVPADLRAGRAEAPTLTAPASDGAGLRDTVREQVAMNQVELPPPSATTRITASTSVPMDPPVRRAGKSVLVSAGLVAVIVVVGWLLVSRRGGEVEDEAPSQAAPWASIAPVERPAAVEAPPAASSVHHPPPPAPPAQPAVSAPKEKAVEAPPPRPRLEAPTPSPTSFRPSEL